MGFSEEERGTLEQFKHLEHLHGACSIPSGALATALDR